jgi:hypothetical protein
MWKNRKSSFATCKRLLICVQANPAATSPRVVAGARRAIPQPLRMPAGFSLPPEDHMSRKPLPFPTRRKDVRIAELEREIRAKAEELAGLAPDMRFTFFWNNLTAMLRNRGFILPGDGKGGFLNPPKE